MSHRTILSSRRQTLLDASCFQLRVEVMSNCCSIVLQLPGIEDEELKIWRNCCSTVLAAAPVGALAEALAGELKRLMFWLLLPLC